MTRYPIVVDLDGTLIQTDMLHESTLRMVREHPLDALRIPSWLWAGRAKLKREVAARTSFNPATLPYNEALLEWLRARRAEGRSIVLCTASDQSVADAVAGRLGLFDEAIGSDGKRNLAGRRKADVLEAKYGRGGFDYAGDSARDHEVWARSRRAIVVNAPRAVLREAQARWTIEEVFPAHFPGFSTWRRTLRMHQWLKSVLLFVPLIAGHEFTNVSAWLALFVAFASFCLCASSVYITNDLLDLESDRMHPRKRLRPFASGQMPAWAGAVLIPVLLASSIALGGLVGPDFLAWLLAYFVITWAYSWSLKRMLLVDCLALAMLYTLRIIAGAATVGHALSFWLLAFSVFLFLSLAFVKRYAELELLLLNGRKKMHGRGYHTSDAPLVQAMGLAAGYSAALVLALYINSEAVSMLYRTPEVIWGTVPVLLFWISWMWLQAHRGKMHDDPMVFAVKDRASWVAGGLFLAVLIAGTARWPW